MLEHCLGQTTEKKKHGTKPSGVDQCLCTHQEEVRVIVAIYVDDILIAAENNQTIKET